MKRVHACMCAVGLLLLALLVFMFLRRRREGYTDEDLSNLRTALKNTNLSPQDQDTFFNAHLAFVGEGGEGPAFQKLMEVVMPIFNRLNPDEKLTVGKAGGKIIRSPKKEQGGGDAPGKSVSSGDISHLIEVVNRNFPTGENFRQGFVEMVPYDIEFRISMTASPDFTGQFALVLSNKERTTNLVKNNANEINAGGGVGEGRFKGSDKSPTDVSLSIRVYSGSLQVKYISVIAKGPVKGARQISNSVEKSESGMISQKAVNTSGPAFSTVPPVSRSDAIDGLKKELDSSGLSDGDKNTIIREIVIVADSDKSKEKMENASNIVLPILGKIKPEEKQRAVARAIEMILRSKPGGSTSMSTPGPITMPMITTGPRTMATTAPGVTKQRTMQEMIADLAKSREGKDLVKNMKNTPGPTASVITSPGMYKCESDSTGFRCTRAS